MVFCRICAFCVLFTFLFAGCSTSVSNTVKASEAHITKYSSLTALEGVAALEKNLNHARESNMPLLAPHYFLEASQILSECQNALGSKPKDVLAIIAAKGDAILEKGRAVMVIVQYRFTSELELKARLDKLGTAKLLPREYESIAEDLSGLIEIVEREQPDNIDKRKAALLKAMRELEIKTIQENALRESDAVNAASRKNNAVKQAPATFAEALRIYQDAKNLIATAPHEVKQVEQLGARALFAAKHAYQINERVALLQAQFMSDSVSAPQPGGAAKTKGQAKGKLSDIEVGPVERIALQEEERMLEIALSLGQKDLRDKPLEMQLEEIKRVAAEILAKNAASASQMPDFEARLKAANNAPQQAMELMVEKDRQLLEKDQQLLEKDQQLLEKDQQLIAQAAQLADKDIQIKTLHEKIASFETENKLAAKTKTEKKQEIAPRK